MKQTLFIGLILLLLIYACDKQKNELIQIRGIVLNAESGEPIEGVLTSLLLSNLDEFIPQPFHDSTWTDSNGIYIFSINNDNYTNYYTFLNKYQYVRKGYDRRRVVYLSKKIDRNMVNTDTIIMGREAVLKLSANVIDPMGTYCIYCDEFVSKNDTNVSLLEYPVWHKIEPYDSKSEFVEKYLYQENHIVPISWFREDLPGDTTTIEVEMIPLDTVYLTIDIQ